jgi:hypothetical protein
METITVNRVTYVVEAVETVEQIEARGLLNAARHMLRYPSHVRPRRSSNQNVINNRPS